VCQYRDVGGLEGEAEIEERVEGIFGGAVDAEVN